MSNIKPENTEVIPVPEDQEDQKLMIERLYVKIDYHKQTRLRIPVFSAVANFGLLTLATERSFGALSTLFFICAFMFIGVVSWITLRVVRDNFDVSINRLRQLYRARKIPESFAESANEIWALLYLLICLGSVFPTVFVGAKFLSGS